MTYIKLFSKQGRDLQNGDYQSKINKILAEISGSKCR